MKVLHSICQQIWKTQQWPRHWKSPFSFQSQRKAIPKNAQTTAQLYSSHTLVKLKILQARLQQSVNCELPDVQAGFRKDRETRDQIANIRWITEKTRELPGASVRNPNHDKLMLQRSDGQGRVRSQVFPRHFLSMYHPKIRICLLFHSSDIPWKKSIQGFSLLHLKECFNPKTPLMAF